MLGLKRKLQSSFGPDGRRDEDPLCKKRKLVSCGSGLGSSSLQKSSSSNTCDEKAPVSNKLFQPGSKLIIQRAPILTGLSVPSGGLFKKFQRPMIKRRSYDKNSDLALQNSSLGQRRRMDGMARLLARAGKGLHFKLADGVKTDAGNETDDTCDSDDDEENKEDERPFEPLMVWKSPHQGGDLKGLPSTLVTEMQCDEFGIEQAVTVKRPAPLTSYNTEDQFVPPVLAKWLRPHQREGVLFMYECVMGLRNYEGHGAILADDMGLGKTLQSVALIYTLLKTSITANKEPTAKRVIVVCPCSLVKNWDNEFVKWLGPGVVKTMALAESDRKTVEKSLDLFVRTKMFQILIVSYETLRTHVGRINKIKDCCDLLVCDEAHRLKNNENQTSLALASLPVKRRVLLTGTPMQNDLAEFFAMVDFCNPMVLGTEEEFRKKFLYPVLRGREPDATDNQKQKMLQVQNDMSSLVNEFILRRINTLNAQHLPPKLVQVVCCRMTDIQLNMYQHLVSSKDMQHVLDGKQVNCLSSIQMLMKLCNHPRLVAEEDQKYSGGGGNVKRAAVKKGSYNEDEKVSAAAPGADGVSKYLPYEPDCGGKHGRPVRPEWSGKMFVLYKLMREMRKPGNGSDKIVIVSNYTQTLDLIGKMCSENSWGFCRLDGAISMKKRQKMVDDFNDPQSSLVAFLLSSKAGGCGLNLIGGNRLVLFDPDWNPAVDKQAAARCWRDGQKKRCFTYRFVTTGTVEEKIYQRQLSKEGLQSIVDDKEQVNALSTKDLRNLFKLRTDTPSDTHDKLRCERCKIVVDSAEQESLKVLPKQLSECNTLITKMMAHDDASYFLLPLKPEEYGVSTPDYDKVVKQPIDLNSIQARLQTTDSTKGYKNVSSVSKDVNRIFANVLKLWEPGQLIADAARRLQSWWDNEWTSLVPRLMSMKADKISTETCASGSDDVETTESNQRSDDFQEQIGMPDEENMRNWSHHHSADTVDDPVFRAAMRDCDLVSFVFGLEVTWSLIQQRQQEEAEKKALLEIGALETVDESDGEESAVKVCADQIHCSAASQKSTDTSDADVNTSPKDKKTKEKVKDWPCPVCTLLNSVSSKKCSACGEKKPGKAKKAES